MRVLLVGGGGREHALAWALSRSPALTRLWCAPGNPGIESHATVVPRVAADDVPGLVALAREVAADLVVVGPEAPLTLGLSDALAAHAIPCFGPTAAAARLEGSKSFCHEVCDAAGVPAAAWARFDDPDAARAHLRRVGAPVVVKADGLAAGKGVTVAMSLPEAEAAVRAAMEEGAHGAAGASVVIEEYMEGEEVSLFALCDGDPDRALFLGAAQDHKRAGEGDTGPNTGGMGAYSPAPALADALRDEAMARVVRPALAEMARRGAPFRGVLFAGLMLTATGPKLIEFNARFGDPECQAILPRLRGDLLPALLAAARGDLSDVSLGLDPDLASLVVVVAARGYPGGVARGERIGGLDAAASVPGARVFHAGTARGTDGAVASNGGRVLSVLGTGPDLRAARDAAYAAVDALDWPGGFVRRDIGWRALGRG